MHTYVYLHYFALWQCARFAPQIGTHSRDVGQAVPCRVQSMSLLQPHARHPADCKAGNDLETASAAAAVHLQADREALSAQLSEMEDWLYGDGEDEKKSVYVTKLEELKARGGPIEQRAADATTRGAAVQQLESIANQYLSLADSSLPAHAHLDAADRETLKKEAGSALSWLQEKVALQSQVRRGSAPGWLQGLGWETGGSAWERFVSNVCFLGVETWGSMARRLLCRAAALWAASTDRGLLFSVQFHG